MGIVEQYLLQLKNEKRRLRRTAAVLTALSILVALGVSWNLRMTGVTLVNDACCGFEEHLHTEDCPSESILICGYGEEEPSAEPEAEIPAEEPDALLPDMDSAEEEMQHIHTEECFVTEYRCGYEEHLHSVTCYSDPEADVETPLDWQEMFADYPYTGNLREDLVGIAGMQVGYAESARNFEADEDGVRHGYTRYGAWYGAPYSEWSAMFVSFCLSYAEADRTEYPISPGADTMAGLWDEQDRYVPAGEYVPVSGDLVFFGDNTVGIVAEVQNATMYVISGDTEDAVSGTVLSLNDSSIDGWGMIDLPPDEEDAGDDFSGLEIPEIPEDTAVIVSEGSDTQPQADTYTSGETGEIKDLLTYVTGNGGTYSFTLTNTDNTPLLKDENGNFIVQTGTVYKLTLTVFSPNGILPGKYCHQLPDGLQVTAKDGEFISNNGTVGEWNVNEDGLITFEFNDKTNNLSGNNISCEFGVSFDEREEPIMFDGNVIVTVKKPPESEEHTILNKWGSQGDETKGEDPTKIYWTLKITGQKDFDIPGSIITDEIIVHEWTKEHKYTESDREAGIYIGAEDSDKKWHEWKVYPGDSGLVWNEDGWIYKMPETVKCNDSNCTEPLKLGNEGWVYHVKYTSTPDPLGTAGKYLYTNSVTLEGQQVTSDATFTHGETGADVVKTGVFHGDAESGKFLWEFQATVPGRKEGERAAYYTQIMDHLRVKNAVNGTVALVTNDADKATVTAVCDGRTISVPHAENAAEEDRFAWIVGWSNEGDIKNTRALLPLCRCDCTAESCHYWDTENSRCGAYHYLPGEWGAYPSGFCYCWTYEQDITFTFSYETDASAVIEAHGGQGLDLQNEVVLQHTVYQPDGTESTITLGNTAAKVPIPGVFRKVLTKDFKENDYIAHYRITVNEAKLNLTDGLPLTIHDVMTPTLVYISGSMVITAEDAAGNRTVLQQGTDYTVEYDGTGKETDDDGNIVHVLDIEILHPQPVMYILDYDTTLNVPENATGGIIYNNYALIELWGEKIATEGTEKHFSNINFSAETYSVTLSKTCALTDKPLPGAVFGLYNAQGGLIAEKTTDAEGSILFQTYVPDGIIFKEHVLYYMQEIQAPPTYLLDDTKYWFVFCNNKEDSCEKCSKILVDTGGIRVPFGKIEIIHAKNFPAQYELPSTGGSGMKLYILCGLILTSVPLVYICSLRRRSERRSRK